MWTVVAPKIFFRELIRICVEEVNNDPFVNSIFLFKFDHQDNKIDMFSLVIIHDPQEDFSSQHEVHLEDKSQVGDEQL